MANISHFTQTVNGVSTTYDIHDANAIPRSGGKVFDGSIYARTVNDDFLQIMGGSTYNNGSYIALYGKNHTTQGGKVLISCRKADGTSYNLQLEPNGAFQWGYKNVAMQEDVVPRSGGAVLTGSTLARADNNSNLILSGGNAGNQGGVISLQGGQAENAGQISLYLNSSNSTKNMIMQPSGTWTWDGTACQITSDQRLKQQIAEIDDKLLDAWEDVNLVQFKYNDAVDQKGKDKARLHTGYVVQQIDKACQSHGVDVSAYGLYCHEEYPEETKEVEAEQADGTKTKERKVIREANEHYSLRYTEVYAVECMYLRRCIKQLTARIEQLEKEREASK